MKLGEPCETCPYKERPGPVLSDGDPETAEIAFVGEAPAFDELSEGRGFAGAAGWELWQLARAAGIERSMCRVMNVVKCLPAKAAAGDYSVDPEAVRHCSIYLEKELKACKKATIVPLGNTALEAVTRILGPEPLIRIRRWRGAILRGS